MNRIAAGMFRRSGSARFTSQLRYVARVTDLLGGVLLLETARPASSSERRSERAFGDLRPLVLQPFAIR
jgi:hypothetical protein